MITNEVENNEQQHEHEEEQPNFLIQQQSENHTSYELSSSSSSSLVILNNNNHNETDIISQLKSPKIIDNLSQQQQLTTNIFTKTQATTTNNSNNNAKTKRKSNNENLNSHLNLDAQQEQKLRQLKKHIKFNTIDVYTNKMNELVTINNNNNTKDDGYEDEDDDEESVINSKSNDDDDDNNETNTTNELDNSENEPVDPRIQIELERLNKASSDINRLENELEEAKQLFMNTKNRQAQRLEYLQKKLGNCISKAKPYYDTLQATEKLQKETQKAVQEFQKAISHYKAAKETLSVAEQTLNSNGISDVWQEYLSETITKINNSKKNADQAEEYHRNKMLEYQMSEKRLQFLEDDLKRNISKSKYYYEEKDRWQMQMEAQKASINELERALTESKRVYSEAMNALRLISDEIHLTRRTRKMRLKQREPCIGAEKPDRMYDNFEKMLNSSKSLENLKKSSDSTDDNNSEECASLDTMSINSKNSSLEKRNQYASKQQVMEYYSFGATTSEPSSRCSSPPTTTQKDTFSDARIIVGESTESLNNKTITETMNLNDTAKTAAIDSVANLSATKVINSNPKLNKSSSLYFATSNASEPRLPTVPANKNPSAKVKPLEIPLLTNLLLYNSAVSKITSDNNQRTNKK